jgi:hypothetical protein
MTAKGITMRRDVRDAFKKVITEFDAREQAAEQELLRIAKAQQDFETEFKRVRDKIIIPILNEIGNMLQQSGWMCQTVPEPPSDPPSFDDAVRFEVFREMMSDYGDEIRPYIAFSGMPEHLKLNITWSTHWSESDEEYPLELVSDDFIAQQVLSFFEQLAAEWAPVSSP